MKRLAAVFLLCAASAFADDSSQSIKIDTVTHRIILPLGATIDFTTPGLTLIGIPVTPTGTGFVHVTTGSQDAAAKLVVNADVDVAAAIAQSKLNLNGNIPAGWLGATSTTAAAGNDSRLSDQRTPLDGSVTTAKVVDANVTTAKIADGAVTYGKIQNVTSAKLLGRYTAGAGSAQEITVSSGLSLDSSGNLTASSSGGNVTGSGLTSGDIITGAGNTNIQDSGVPLTNLQSQYQTVTVSAAGNTNSNTAVVSHTFYCTANAGAGAYTATLSIPTSGRAAGDRDSLHIHFAASANPTVEIHNNTSGGTLLFTWTGDGSVTDILAECRFDGTAWYVHDAHFVW